MSDDVTQKAAKMNADLRANRTDLIVTLVFYGLVLALLVLGAVTA